MSSRVTAFPQCTAMWSAKAQGAGCSPERDKGVFLPSSKRDEEDLSNQLFLDLSPRANHSLPIDYAGHSPDDCSEQAHLSMYCIKA